MSEGLKIIEAWQASPDEHRRNAAIRLRSLYELLAEKLFSQYEPTKMASVRVDRDFLCRVERWLEGLDNDDDRWAAFRSIEYLFFAGQDEFSELYRCAHERVLVKWLVDQEGLDIFSPDIDAELNRALGSCWLCPVTDSLRINGFLHQTGLKGQDLRPDWLSLRELGCPEKIKSYVKKNDVKYLVLLEDFVGAGGQLSRVLKFAATAFDGPILVVPLVVCAPGDRKIQEVIHSTSRGDIAYEPILLLDDACLVGEAASAKEPPLFRELRRVLKAVYGRLGKNPDGDVFGWKNVGSLAVLYSNCPNNTPPMFHQESPNWKPVFPRKTRS